MNTKKIFIVCFCLILIISACGKENSPSEGNTLPLAAGPQALNNNPGDPTFFDYQLITDCTIGMGVTPVDTDVVLSPGCDIWDRNKIERPFDNETVKTYYQASDISRAQFGNDETWIFAQVITYLGTSYESVPMEGTYGLELDLNMDARGDILIMVSKPTSDWSVVRVQVWQDTNADNGGETPMVAEETNIGDGYDKILFDQGFGDDPDLAWARISPDDPNIVQFAFKKELAGEKLQFSWLAWAGLVDLDPDKFEFVDTYGEDVLYTLDNTCSWTFGIQLQGLPGQCGIFTEPPKEGQSCPGEPPGGCGDPWAGFYWDAAECQCAQCQGGQFWDPATQTCEAPE